MLGTWLQDTDQPLPQDICEALMKKKRAYAGLLTKRQLLFGRYIHFFLSFMHSLEILASLSFSLFEDYRMLIWQVHT